MDEGRLGHIRRRENNHRKYVCILNDMAKSRWEITDEGLTREQYVTGIQFERSVVSLRRTVVKQRVLQECMKMRREGLKHTDKWLGRYGGKNSCSFSRDIDQYLTEMHPKRRRLKKIQTLKKESVEKGKILSPSAVEVKMKDYFNKITEKDVKQESPGLNMFPEEEERIDIFKRTRNFLPPLRGLINQYPRFEQKDIRNEADSAKLKSNDSLKAENLVENNQNSRKDNYDTSDKIIQPESNDLKFERKSSLILPPIQTTKLMVLNRNN